MINKNKISPFNKDEITRNLCVGDEILCDGSFIYTSYVIAIDKKYAYLGKKEDIKRVLTSSDKITWHKLHIGVSGNKCMQVNFTYVVYSVK